MEVSASGDRLIFETRGIEMPIRTQGAYDSALRIDRRFSLDNPANLRDDGESVCRL
jgi:hypothetical protein